MLHTDSIQDKVQCRDSPVTKTWFLTPRDSGGGDRDMQRACHSSVLDSLQKNKEMVLLEEYLAARSSLVFTDMWTAA